MKQSRNWEFPTARAQQGPLRGIRPGSWKNKLEVENLENETTA